MKHHYDTCFWFGNINIPRICDLQKRKMPRFFLATGLAYHLLSSLCSVWAEEEGGEGGRGESGHGASLRGVSDTPEEGDPAGLRRRRRRGRGEHPRHCPQVSARTSTGHVQEVKKQQQQIK